MKKKLNQIANAIIAVLFIGMIALVFTGLMSCNTIEHLHTSETFKKDSLIFIPGDTVKESLNVDSILKIQAGKWYKVTDSLHRANLKYMRDKFNNLNMQADCPPDTLHEKHTFTFDKDKTTVTKIVHKTPWYIWLLLGAISSICALLFVLYLIRR